MLNVKEKQKIVEKFRTHEKDTGSSAVQIAIVSEEIKRLADHLKTHHKDNHSRRGLLQMVAKRKSLLDYLAEDDPKGYNTVVRKLGLKKKKVQI
ncbi:MAG: 30S ribosomal protein S15 [Candidatus Niyogibacteria bacterium]|nr:30S ribosomal protein S15 [Candidatus Niyogibacteria bacterium]